MEIRATERWSVWCLMWPINRADSRFAPGQWETSLQSNAVSHWLGANLESALYKSYWWWMGEAIWPLNPMQWVSARKTKLQCISNGVTSFLHKPIEWVTQLWAHPCKTTHPTNSQVLYARFEKYIGLNTLSCGQYGLIGHWGIWANDWRISYLYQEIIC